MYTIYYWLYDLVDEIYPEYSRFVKAIQAPKNKAETQFVGWQEVARKNIEGYLVYYKENGSGELSKFCNMI